MVELLPGNRLVLGPSLSAKRSYSITDMLLDFRFNYFVNLLPSNGKACWYMDQDRGTLIQKLQKYTGDDYVRCLSFPISSEHPAKDKQLFSFITRLCAILKKDPQARMYIHDGNGTHAAASVALPLVYFLKSVDEKKDFDPIKWMKRRGKHHVIPDRKKAFVKQIQRMCELDDKSMHRHIFKKKDAKEEKKRKQSSLFDFPQKQLTSEQKKARQSTFTL